MPLVLLVVVSRELPTSFAGLVAILLTVAGYATQIVVAAEIESRLPGENVPRPPKFIGISLVAAVFAAALAGWYPEASIVALVIALPGLEVTRTLAVVSGSQRVEWLVALCSAAGLAVALWANSLSVGLLSLCLLAATASTLRFVALLPLSPPTQKRPGWCWTLGETVATGIVQPVVAFAILLLLGPAATVGLRMVLTVGNLLSPALSVMRIRLLARPNLGDAIVLISILLAGAGMIVVAHASGVAHLVFGTAWNYVSLTALLCVLLWKLLSAGSTIPFSSIRRLGDYRTTFVLRCISALAYIVLAFVFLGLGAGQTGVPVAYVFGEGCCLVLFVIALWRARKTASSSTKVIAT